MNLAAAEVNSALFCGTQRNGSSAGHLGGKASLPVAVLCCLICKRLPGCCGRRPAICASLLLGSDCVRRVLLFLPAQKGFPGVLWRGDTHIPDLVHGVEDILIPV